MQGGYRLAESEPCHPLKVVITQNNRSIEMQELHVVENIAFVADTLVDLSILSSVLQSNLTDSQVKSIANIMQIELDEQASKLKREFSRLNQLLNLNLDPTEYNVFS